MDYKVMLTADAEDDLNRAIRYLLLKKRNPQAAASVLDDFEETKESLTRTAGSLALCSHPKLKQMGYRKIHFLTHRYFMVYRLVEDTAIVDGIFHDLQDFENKLTL